MPYVSRKPVLRVRKSGALIVAALIAFVGTAPFAGASWQLAPIMLIPLAILVWTWRAGTDVFTDRLRVRALLGSTTVPWSRVAELASDSRGQVSALLSDGKVLKLTGVTRRNLPNVIAASGQELTSSAASPDDEPASPAQ
jgi:PH (Pleckstrin Homology) domain-containing protein